MQASEIIPILNVRDIHKSLNWFQQLGCITRWIYGEPANFASVGLGDVTIYICLNSQGGRDENASYLSLWVDDVDSVFDQAVEQGIEISMKPTNFPWNVREAHLRHPDGHILRVSKVFGTA